MSDLDYSQQRSFNVGIAVETNSVGAAMIYDDLVYAQKVFGTGFFYRSHDQMLKRFPMFSERTIRRHIDKLEQHGWLSTKIKKVDGTPLCHYQIVRFLSAKMSISKDSDKMSKSINKETKETTKPDSVSFGANSDSATATAPAHGPNPVHNFLNELIQIINPREKATDERKRMLHARLKDYTTEEILQSAKAFSHSKWHKENRQMSIDNLLMPSKFGRWYAKREEVVTAPATGGRKLYTEDEDGNHYWGGELITPENQDRILAEQEAQE